MAAIAMACIAPALQEKLALPSPAEQQAAGYPATYYEIMSNCWSKKYLFSFEKNTLSQLCRDCDAGTSTRRSGRRWHACKVRSRR